MNDASQTAFDTTTRIAAADDGAAYDNVSIWLHWATALLVVNQFALSQTWGWFGRPVHEFMEDMHMSFGVVLTAVIVGRIVWRSLRGHRASTATIGWVRRLSKSVHYLLYALLVIEAGLGFAFRWGAGRPMEFFGLGIPPMIGEIARPDRHFLRDLHEWIGWTIIVIALLHALAVLYHHYVIKDGLLRRMLPRRAQGACHLR